MTISWPSAEGASDTIAASLAVSLAFAAPWRLKMAAWMCFAGEGGGNGRFAVLVPVACPFAGDGEALNGDETLKGDGLKEEEEALRGAFF